MMIIESNEYFSLRREYDESIERKCLIIVRKHQTMLSDIVDFYFAIISFRPLLLKSLNRLSSIMMSETGTSNRLLFNDTSNKETIERE